MWSCSTEVRGGKPRQHEIEEDGGAPLDMMARKPKEKSFEFAAGTDIPRVNNDDFTLTCGFVYLHVCVCVFIMVGAIELMYNGLFVCVGEGGGGGGEREGLCVRVCP